MISDDVYLHLDLISNSHNCIFGLNVLSVISATITWRFLICRCWGGDSQTMGTGRFHQEPWPWEWFGTLGSAV